MFRRTTQTGNLLYGKISPDSNGKVHEYRTSRIRQYKSDAAGVNDEKEVILLYGLRYMKRYSVFAWQVYMDLV